MKLFIMAAMASAFLILSCKKSAEEKMVDQQETLKEPEFTFDNSWTQNIQLNGGKKWKANPETTEAVSKMLHLIKSSPTSTLDEHRDLAASLNLEKNILIEKCTMKGDAHTHLHTFLEPLIDKIKALSEATSTEQAITLKNAIEENLTLYSTYFE